MLYTTIERDHPPLFHAVGCVCILEGKVLLLKRVPDKSYPGHWGIPSGKLNDNETPLLAVIRELYEETGILVSSDNLRLVGTYHVVGQDMSFLYTLYTHRLQSSPAIKITKNEHVNSSWFAPHDALRLDLIPDLDECLKEVFPNLKEHSLQLNLFTQQPRWVSDPTGHLEKTSEERSVNLTSSAALRRREIFISFGPPATGKTTLFKELLLRNPERTLVYDNTILSRGSNLNQFLRKAFEEDQRAFFFHFQLESLLVRFKYTLTAPEGSFVDESIYTTLAYSRALYRLKWLNKMEYQVFHNYYLLCFNLLPIPKEVIYVSCDTAVMKKRLFRRNRKHEKYYSDEYIEALHFAFAELANELEENHALNVIRIDSGGNMRTMVDQYVKHQAV